MSDIFNARCYTHRKLYQDDCSSVYHTPVRRSVMSELLNEFSKCFHRPMLAPSF